MWLIKLELYHIWKVKRGNIRPSVLYEHWARVKLVWWPHESAGSPKKRTSTCNDVTSRQGYRPFSLAPTPPSSFNYCRSYCWNSWHTWVGKHSESVVSVTLHMLTSILLRVRSTLDASRFWMIPQGQICYLYMYIYFLHLVEQVTRTFEHQYGFVLTAWRCCLIITAESFESKHL